MSSKSMLKKKKNRDPRSFLERFLTTRILVLLGLFFLLIGLFFSVSSSDGSNKLWEAILLLFKPTSGIQIFESNWSVLPIVLKYFLPAIIILFISTFYVNKYKFITYPVTIAIAFYLIFMQLIIILNQVIWYYPNFYMAIVFLFFTITPLLILTIRHNKIFLLLISSFYFYISTVLFAADYTSSFDYLFITSLIFSVAIAWIGKKIKYNYINIINMFFIISFFLLFMIRKFIVNSRPENLLVFFTFSILFYITIYLITLFASNNKENPLGFKTQVLMIWSNLLFYLGTNSFILIKYYSFNYIWVLVLALLVFNLLGLLLINKYKLNSHLFPYYSVIILLASLVLPLLIQQNILFLFSLIFSVFMLFYANLVQNKFAFWLSLATLAISILLFFKLWLTGYLLVMFALGVLPEYTLLWTGIVNGLVLLLALRIIKTRIKAVSEYITIKWFMPVFKQVLFSLFQITLFLSLGWILFTIQYIITASVIFSSLVWLITGCLYFIFYVKQFAGISSSHKKAAHYLAFGFVLFYPLLMGWNIFQQHLIVSGEINAMAVLLHYIAVVLLVILGAMAVKRVYKRNGKYLLMQNGVQFITFIYLAYFVCTELDTLWLVFAAILNRATPDFILHAGLIEFNKYLPYTTVLWILAITEFLYGVFYHKPFLRMLALYLFIVVLIKLFLLDFEMMNAQARSAVFFGLGLFLIIFALLYPKLKAATARSKKKFALKEDE